jgi:hypothetical protein
MKMKNFFQETGIAAGVLGKRGLKRIMGIEAQLKFESGTVLARLVEGPVCRPLVPSVKLMEVFRQKPCVSLERPRDPD